MRCKNCGWPNKPQTTHCVKCHAVLTTSEEPADTYSQQPSYHPDAEADLNQTVLESDVFHSSRYNYVKTGEFSSDRLNYDGDGAFDNEDTPAATCAKCGYPLRPDADKCPHCRFPVHASHAEPSVSAEASAREDTRRRPTRMDISGREGKMRGTINPYMMNVELDPTFALQPVKRMNERREPEEQEYEGKEVVLNRDNTEAGNSSITSRRQAVITREDGRWFIQDQSEQKTTFVQAARKIELKEGDLILLGNRLFEFHG